MTLQTVTLKKLEGCFRDKLKMCRREIYNNREMGDKLRARVEKGKTRFSDFINNSPRVCHQTELCRYKASRFKTSGELQAVNRDKVLLTKKFHELKAKHAYVQKYRSISESGERSRAEEKLSEPNIILDSFDYHGSDTSFESQDSSFEPAMTHRVYDELREPGCRFFASLPNAGRYTIHLQDAGASVGVGLYGENLREKRFVNQARGKIGKELKKINPAFSLLDNGEFS